MTGMDVTWDIFPEDVYFDKVTAALSSGSTEYDAFMTGAYMTWTYGPAGWIADLNEYIKDPAKTNPNYNWDDVLPGLRASTSWNGVPGGELGSADAKQWCIPWGYELNNISYNKKMFDKVGVQPPKNLDELVASLGQAHQGPRRTLRHRRARLALLGHDPSGLPLGLCQLRREGLQRHRRQAEGRHEHGRLEGLPQATG